jgi:uncharacterized protein YggE
VCVLIVLMIPAGLGAQMSRDSVISVTVTRSFRLAPDRATFFVTIDGTAETSRDALAVGDAKLLAVLSALRNIGDGVVLGTPTPFSVAPPPSSRGFPGTSSGATVTSRTAVRATITRLSELARTFAAATDAGATGTSALAFQSSAADSARRVELAVALSTARQDAAVIARALDGRVGGLVEVQSSSDDRVYFNQTAMLPMEGFAGQPTLAPEVLGSVSVTVRFKLIR